MGCKRSGPSGRANALPASNTTAIAGLAGSCFF